jgi:outer membrane protein assembly factor BamD
MKKPYLLYTLLLALLLASCAGNREFQKLLKSGDNEQKLISAREYVKTEDYTRSLSLLENVTPFFRGTKYAHEVMFLTAKSHFGMKDYFSAASYFESYYKLYPRDRFADESMFMEGYSYYLESPDAKLDQDMTKKGIAVFEAFVEQNPSSSRMPEALKYLDELKEKLAEKELKNVQLYYNMGIFLGNNYRAAAITADNAIKDYPASKYREEFSMLILRSKFKEAEVSVARKQEDRFAEALDAFENYKSDFPEGKYMEEATKIETEILKNLK